MLYKRSRRTEEKNAEALLSALLREVMPDGGKIPVRQLSDGRARAQLREKPFLALEVETFRAEAKSRTGAIRPTGAERPAWTMQESFRARLLTETKEEIFLFPSSPPSPDLPSDISSCTDRPDPAAALAARLRAGANASHRQDVLSRSRKIPVEGKRAGGFHLSPPLEGIGTHQRAHRREDAGKSGRRPGGRRPPGRSL